MWCFVSLFSSWNPEDICVSYLSSQNPEEKTTCGVCFSFLALGAVLRCWSLIFRVLPLLLHDSVSILLSPSLSLSTSLSRSLSLPPSLSPCPSLTLSLFLSFSLLLCVLLLLPHPTLSVPTSFAVFLWLILGFPFSLIQTLGSLYHFSRCGFWQAQLLQVNFSVPEYYRGLGGGGGRERTRSSLSSLLSFPLAPFLSSPLCSRSPRPADKDYLVFFSSPRQTLTILYSTALIFFSTLPPQQTLTILYATALTVLVSCIPFILLHHKALNGL